MTFLSLQMTEDKNLSIIRFSDVWNHLGNNHTKFREENLFCFKMTVEKVPKMSGVQRPFLWRKIFSPQNMKAFNDENEATSFKKLISVKHQYHESILM